MQPRNSKLKTTPAIAQKVRWIRQQAGWTQAEAAAEMGVARETFTRWETGAAVIPPAKLHRLKHLAHVSLADFVPELLYDDDGYPAPFNRKEYDALADNEEAQEEYLKKLVKLEGADFPHRQLQRDISFDALAYGDSFTPARRREALARAAKSSLEYYKKLVADIVG